MKRGSLCLVLVLLIFVFATGHSLADCFDDHDFWGSSADDVFDPDDLGMDEGDYSVLQRMFYQSDPATGTMHPDFEFTNLDLYWDDFPGGPELIYEFDLITPHVTYYGGFYCRELNGFPVGGHEQYFTCVPFRETNNQFLVSGDLLGHLVPGETYAWNVFILYEGEVIESPVQHFVHGSFEDAFGHKKEGPNTPIIFMQSADLTVEQGEDATLMVMAHVGLGEVAYQWYSCPIRTSIGGTRITGATESYYSAPTDEAEKFYYYCQVTNIKDESYGEELTTVVSKPIEVEVLPGEKAAGYAYVDFDLKLAKGGRQSVVLKIPWDDSQFEGMAIQYNGNLAVAALALAKAAYSQANVQDTLGALGFEQIKLDYNEDNQQKEYVCFAFGTKRYERRGRTTNVVAVALRGTTDYIEWADNFIRQAKGFAGAEEKVWTSLMGYIGELESADELKFLIAGHSRGAAVANILGTRLTNSFYGSSQTVFVYSFATPNTTTAREKKFYQNVMSWNNKNDLVCFLPTGQKHGVVHWFSPNEDPAMNEYFQRLTGLELSDYGPLGSVKSSHAPETYLAFLLTISPDVTIE